jgi:hypothetical protein
MVMVVVPLKNVIVEWWNCLVEDEAKVVNDG